MNSCDPRRHVFRYDEHMPDTDDLSLIALKGHLLVEEMLVELAELLLPNPRYLQSADLSFYKLANVVRAATPLRSDDKCWELIFALSTLRNDPAHNLESSKLTAKVKSVLDLADAVQPCPEMPLDKSVNAEMDVHERLRHAVVDCMQFLRMLIFAAEAQAEPGGLANHHSPSAQVAASR